MWHPLVKYSGLTSSFFSLNLVVGEQETTSVEAPGQPLLSKLAPSHEHTAHGQPADTEGRRRFPNCLFCKRCALLTRVFFKSFYLFLKYVT